MDINKTNFHEDLLKNINGTLKIKEILNNLPKTSYFHKMKEGHKDFVDQIKLSVDEIKKTQNKILKIIHAAKSTKNTELLTNTISNICKTLGLSENDLINKFLIVDDNIYIYRGTRKKHYSDISSFNKNTLEKKENNKNKLLLSEFLIDREKQIIHYQEKNGKTTKVIYNHQVVTKNKDNNLTQIFILTDSSIFIPSIHNVDEPYIIPENHQIITIDKGQLFLYDKTNQNFIVQDIHNLGKTKNTIPYIFAGNKEIQENTPLDPENIIAQQDNETTEIFTSEKEFISFDNNGNLILEGTILQKKSNSKIILSTQNGDKYFSIHNFLGTEKENYKISDYKELNKYFIISEENSDKKHIIDKDSNKNIFSVKIEEDVQNISKIEIDKNNCFIYKGETLAYVESN